MGRLEKKNCNSIFVLIAFISFGLFKFSILDKGPRSNFLGTNLHSCEANWILELECSLVPILILGFPNQSSPFSIVFWSEPIDFPSKIGAILASICYFLILDLHLKALGPIQSFSTNKIVWIHWSLYLGPSSKLALSFMTFTSIIPLSAFRSKQYLAYTCRFSSPKKHYFSHRAVH